MAEPFKVKVAHPSPSRGSTLMSLWHTATTSAATGAFTFTFSTASCGADEQLMQKRTADSMIAKFFIS